MINKLIVSAAAGLAMLGSTLAVADCPAYLNAEEGVPCIVQMTIEKGVEKAAVKMDINAPREREQTLANIESWMKMAQDQ